MAGDTRVISIACVAHELWCDRMGRAGWRRGASFNLSAQAHDAMVPFAELDPRDRRSLLAAVRASGVLDLLAAAVEYPRGAFREIGAREVRVGLPVTDRGGVARGTVQSWETDPGGQVLDKIRVRWEDGQLTEHYPPEAELRVVG